MSEYRQTISTGRLTGVPVTENYEPRREPSRHSDVSVPLLQATISAALLTLFCSGIAAALVYAVAWLWIPVLFIGLLTVFWFWSLGWVKGTLYRIETLIDHDLTGDDEIGEPELRPVKHNSMTSPRTQDAAAAERQRRLREFVAISFQHGTDGRTMKTHGFSDAETKLFGNYLRNIGLATWNNDHNHKDGWHYLRTEEQVAATIEHTVWTTNRPAAER